nr:NADH dehydrogenase subunit 6 [Monopterus albus]
MAFIVYLFLAGLVVGLIGIAANPSPYFAALGLVVVSGMGCGVLTSMGGSFLSLVLFLVYLGGMLVVFAYSAALSAEPYPEGWGSWSVLMYVGVYMLGVVYVWVGLLVEWDGFWGGFVDDLGEVFVVRGDIGGVAMMYGVGGEMLMVGGWGLLLALFVVLELTRGLSRGSLRMVY